MTGDELERTIQFILEQQARTEALRAHNEELWARNEEKWVRNEEKWARNEERLARADERWMRTEEGIRSLLSIAEIHEREIESMRETTRATDERLNALITIVERFISEGRNGNA